LKQAKKAAAAILKLQGQVEEVLSDGVSRSAVEIQQAIGSGTNEVIFWILRHLTGNNRGYVAQGSWDRPASMRFSKG
jgi:glucose-6-phosphate isomerase